MIFAAGGNHIAGSSGFQPPAFRQEFKFLRRKWASRKVIRSPPRLPLVTGRKYPLKAAGWGILSLFFATWILFQL
jgi:hypothetical protein